MWSQQNCQIDKSAFIRANFRFQIRSFWHLWKISHSSGLQIGQDIFEWIVEFTQKFEIAKREDKADSLIKLFPYFHNCEPTSKKMFQIANAKLLSR